MKRYRTLQLAKIVLLLILMHPTGAAAKDVLQVETGTYQSASWQFSLELSELWEKNFPETETGFAPTYTESVEERFSQLIAKNSRLVIAPLTAAVNQMMFSRPVKIVSLLWTVHLVPIDIGVRGRTITLSSYRYWYVPEHAVIISELMFALKKSFLAAEIRSQYQRRSNYAGSPDVPEQSLNNTAPVSADERDSVMGYLQEADDTGVDSIGFSSRESRISFRRSAEIAGLDDFKSTVIQVTPEMIPEIVNEYQDGILFVETIGSVNHLTEALNASISTVELKDNIRDFLISIHPWIQPVYKSRMKLQTLEFNMALFVHAEEEAEFVENILKLLTDRPKTYFPASFIFSNLNVQKTKDISPLFIHPSSLKHFGLD